MQAHQFLIEHEMSWPLHMNLSRLVLLKFRGSEHYVFPTASTKLFNIIIF